MHPRKFRDRWGLDGEKMARLTGRRPSTVNHWLTDPSKTSYENPPKEVEDYLSTVDTIWTLLNLLKKVIKQVEGTIDTRLSKKILHIYEEVMETREDPPED
jgi:hypothetical protein